jgi:hypothetical protein
MQKFMDKLFRGLGWRLESCCVDDIVLYSKYFSEHVHFDEVFRILSDAGLTLKAEKTVLFFHSIELLGNLINCLGLMTTAQRTEAICNLLYPRTLRNLEHYIGTVNWDRSLIPFFA